MAGIAAGALLLGYLADRIGQKRTIVLSLALYGISSVPFAATNLIAVSSLAIFLCFAGSLGFGVTAAAWMLPSSGLFMSIIYPTLNSKAISCFSKNQHAAANLDLYQVYCTFYDALAREDFSYLLARAIQFFLPGIPQVFLRRAVRADTVAQFPSGVRRKFRARGVGGLHHRPLLAERSGFFAATSRSARLHVVPGVFTVCKYRAAWIRRCPGWLTQSPAD
jgi:hypothetical protein